MGCMHHHHTQLGKLTAPKTVGQLQQAPRIPHIPNVRGTGERGKGKRSFLFFLAHLHTSKAEPHTERGFRAGPQKKVSGERFLSCTHGWPWGATDRGICSGNRSAGQKRGSTFPDETNTSNVEILCLLITARAGLVTGRPSREDRPSQLLHGRERVARHVGLAVQPCSQPCHLSLY